MVVTGFAMYGQSNPDGFFYRAFNWVGILFGGMPVVRFVHHVLDLGLPDLHPDPRLPRLRADHLERTGVISSIISGGRFVPADEKYIDGDDA